MVDEPWGPLPLSDVETPTHRGKFIDIETVGAVIQNATIDFATVTNINVDSGTIGNLTIDGDLTLGGGVIKTDADGNRRVELSSAGVDVYNASDVVTGRLAADATTGLMRLSASTRYVEVNSTRTEISGPLRMLDNYVELPNTDTAVTTYPAAGASYSGATGSYTFMRSGSSTSITYPLVWGWIADKFFIRTGSDITVGTSYFAVNGNGGQVQAIDGSAATPAYSFLASGQQDVGMYRAGTDVLGFSVGGTAIATLSNPSGSIGRLTLGSETNDYIQMDGADESWDFYIDSTKIWGLDRTGNESRIYGAETNDWIFNDNVTEEWGFALDSTEYFNILKSVVIVGAPLFRLPIKTTTGDPTATDQGDMYVNTADNVLKVYEGGAWRTVASW